MEQVNESPRTKKTSVRLRIILSFFLGIIAGAAAMFSAGFLYLRHNLIVSCDFPDLTAADFDDAFGYEIPAEDGWIASREVCSLPMPTNKRAVYNWKLCHREYAKVSAAAVLPELPQAARLRARMATSAIAMIFFILCSSILLF